MRPSKNPPSDIAAISSGSKKGAIADGIGNRIAGRGHAVAPMVGIDGPHGLPQSGPGGTSRMSPGATQQEVIK